MAGLRAAGLSRRARGVAIGGAEGLVDQVACPDRQDGGARIEAVAVAGVADPVVVRVGLQRVRRAHAVVGAIIECVAVLVAAGAAAIARGATVRGSAGGHLVWVVDVGAVVDRVDLAVEVDVVEVAGVAHAVGVRVQLARVGDPGAVVADVAAAVAVRVRLRDRGRNDRVVVERAVVRRTGDIVIVDVAE